MIEHIIAVIFTLAGISGSTNDAAIAKRPVLNRADCHLGNNPIDMAIK